MRIVLPSTFWLHFRGSQALQKACQMVPQWSPKFPKSLKNTKNLGVQKTCKNRLPKSRQKCHDSAKWGLRKTRFRDPFLMKFEKVAKMAPLGVPGSKRHPKGMQRPPKGSQKVSRKHENDVQKASSIEFDKQLNKQFDRQFEKQFHRQATRQFNRQFKRQFYKQFNKQYSIGNAIGNSIGNSIGNT